VETKTEPISGRQLRCPPAEAIAMIAETGFDAVSPVWESREKSQEVCVLAREAGLFVESLHAPFSRTSLF